MAKLSKLTTQLMHTTSEAIAIDEYILFFGDEILKKKWEEFKREFNKLRNEINENHR